MTTKRGRRPGQRWTPAELDYIRTNSTLGAERLAEHLGSTAQAVRHIASREGIPLISQVQDTYTVDCPCGVSFTVARLRKRARRQTLCESCRHREWRAKNERAVISPEAKMLYSARKRARERDVSFDLSIVDIVIPELCPVLGIALEPRRGASEKGPADNSPTLDRIVPELGYVPGNVQVISWRANKIKSDASLRELEAIVEWIRSRS